MLPPSTFQKDIDNVLHVAVISACLFAYPYLSNEYGYSESQQGINRLAYMFAHANILHLVMNLSAYYILSRNILGTIYSPICLAIGWLATFGTEMADPTIGMSAVCFAQMGVIAAYLYRHKWVKEMLISAALVNTLGIIMGSMNIWLHLASFIYAFALSFILKRFI